MLSSCPEILETPKEEKNGSVDYCKKNCCHIKRLSTQFQVTFNWSYISVNILGKKLFLKEGIIFQKNRYSAWEGEGHNKLFFLLLIFINLSKIIHSGGLKDLVARVAYLESKKFSKTDIVVLIANCPTWLKFSGKNLVKISFLYFFALIILQKTLKKS